MKIAMVQTPFFPLNLGFLGGMERVILEEVQRLIPKGHEVTVYANKVIGKRPHVICLSRMNKMNSRKEAYFLVKLLVRNPTAETIIGFDAPLLALLSPKRACVFYHDETFFHLPLFYSPSWHLISQERYRRVLGCYSRARFIFCSDYLRGRFMKRYPQIPPHRLYTLLSGVNVHRFVPRQASRRPGPVRFSFHGRWYWYKGLLVLLEAVRILSGRRQDFECYIAGSPGFPFPTSDSVVFGEIFKEMAGRYENIHFTGAISHEELPHYLQDMDVGIVPSLYEPLGMTPLEIMACGLPVIASRVGGIPETVLDGVTGLLVEPDDPVVLSEAMARLMDDAELRRRMGEMGRQHVEQKFSWETHVDRLLDIVGAA